MAYFAKQQARYPPRNALQKAILDRAKWLDVAQVDYVQSLRAQLTQLVQELNETHPKCSPMEVVDWQDKANTPMITIKEKDVHSSTLIYWGIYQVQIRLIDVTWYYVRQQEQQLINVSKNHL